MIDREHTPGPWVVAPPSERHTMFDDYTIADLACFGVFGPTKSRGSRDAVTGGDAPGMKEARAEIAKARGA